MKIYHYDPKTGVYIGASEAIRDPLETKKQGKEIYLMPGYATIEAPPDVNDHAVAVFEAGAWHIAADYRGSIWWRQDGSKYTIEALDIVPAETDVDHDPRPSVCHDFDGNEWILNRNRWLNSEIRPRRNQLLNEVDTIYCNADRWESMTMEQKQAWREYKQALRDLPAIIDSFNPVWPTAPEE